MAVDVNQCGLALFFMNDVSFPDFFEESARRHSFHFLNRGPKARGVTVACDRATPKAIVTQATGTINRGYRSASESKSHRDGEQRRKLHQTRATCTVFLNIPRRLYFRTGYRRSTARMLRPSGSLAGCYLRLRRTPGFYK